MYLGRWRVSFVVWNDRTPMPTGDSPDLLIPLGKMLSELLHSSSSPNEV